MLRKIVPYLIGFVLGMFFGDSLKLKLMNMVNRDQDNDPNTPQ